jgi:asparagine synthase (glutamine-hydrolysing)
VCGIAGTIVYGPTAALPREADLLAVREAMQRRGPDGAGIWFNEERRVGLAHRRLAVIDLSDRGLQPMHHGDFTITFNGEIYNYKDLRDHLIREHAFRPTTESDTEVLLALFSAYGTDMLGKLRGMFAFAIWDRKSKRLFLARDQYGIKPLYFSNTGGALHFASQVKALKMMPGISGAADPAALVGFYLTGSIPEPYTYYQAIRSLPAGHYMWVDENGPGDPQRYAHPAETLATVKTDKRGSIDEVVADAVCDSVRSHMVADVEVGLFLSAGIDSGTLLAVMRDIGHNSVRAITLGFKELRGTLDDEVPLARKIARQYGAEHYIRNISSEEFSASAEQILEDMDQPTVDGINTWFVSKAAHECGLKVVLSGLGADELLAGYSTFPSVPRIRRWIGPISKLPFASRFARFALERFAPDWTRRNPKVLGVLEHSGSWAGAYLLRRALMLPFELDRAIEREVLREGLKRLRPFALIEQAMTPDPRSDVARISALESSLYMRNQLLRDSDWASMAHSLELRVPFVDWKMFTEVAPLMARLGGGRGKAALARAPSVSLPQECISRPKTGFSIPLTHWLRSGSGATGGFVSRQWAARVSEAFGLA